MTDGIQVTELESRLKRKAPVCYDTPYRILVPSFTDPLTSYLVDLKEHGGNGRCGCEHFQFRLAPQMPSDGSAPPHPMRCKHIRRAREFVLNAILDTVEVSDGLERQR